MEITRTQHRAARLAAAALLFSVPCINAQPQAPDQVVRETATAMMAEIRQRHAELSDDPEKLYTLVEDKLLPHFDLNTIARLVLGRHWSKASPEQRGRFMVAFQRLLIRSYAKALLTFKDGSFEWLPPATSAEEDNATVDSVVKHNNSQLNVQYRLRRVDDRWQVYDISIDGISLVTNYRGTFNSEIRRSNIEDVILRLEQRAHA